jgi:hypothetical protein
VIDLLTGYVTIMFSVPLASVPHVKAGKQLFKKCHCMTRLAQNRDVPFGAKVLKLRSGRAVTQR